MSATSWNTCYPDDGRRTPARVKLLGMGVSTMMTILLSHYNEEEVTVSFLSFVVTEDHRVNKILVQEGGAIHISAELLPPISISLHLSFPIQQPEIALLRNTHVSHICRQSSPRCGAPDVCTPDGLLISTCSPRISSYSNQDPLVNGRRWLANSKTPWHWLGVRQRCSKRPGYG